MRWLAGAGTLARLALRRDRVQLAAWTLGIPTLVLLVVASVDGLYADAAERRAAAAFAAASPLARAFDGPASGSSLGAMVIAESFVMLAVLVGLMSTFAVVRHTRQNEEAGREELLGASVVGRYAPLAAALGVASAGAVLVGAATSAVLLVRGLPVAGSILTGAALAVTGIVFAASAALAAQVFESSRGANGAGAAVIGLAFLLRAVGDASGSLGPTRLEVVSAWPSWLSPIGWGQQTRPFHQNQWEPLLLSVGLVVLLSVLAVLLVARRDLGSGVLAVRPGPGRAGPWLRGPFGLAWRLQRWAVLGWVVGLGVVAAAFGALGDEAGELIATSEQLTAAFEGMAAGADLVDVYLAVMLGLLGTVAGGFVVQSLLRLRTEEASGSAERLLAMPLSRWRWLSGHVAVTVLGTALVLLGYGLAVGQPLTGLTHVLPAMIALLLPTLVLAGFVLAIFAALPRLMAPVAWTALAWCLLLGQLGGLLDLPQWIRNLSPYTHLPQLPAASMSWVPASALATVAVGLTAAAFIVFRRRDLAL